VRMCLPRRVYTNSHIDYVADAAERIVARKDTIPGYRVAKESAFLRHFTCDLSVCPAGRVEASR